MKRMSFSMTLDAFRRGDKCVTRRLGWRGLRVGDFVMAVEKSQGLKRGESHKKLGPIEITNVRREPLSTIRDEGLIGTTLEGFPTMRVETFIDHFCRAMRCDQSTEVARIAFRRVACTKCGTYSSPKSVNAPGCVAGTGIMECVGCKTRYCLACLPEKCDCGRELFGSWARANAAISDAPAIDLKKCPIRGFRPEAIALVAKSVAADPEGFLKFHEEVSAGIDAAHKAHLRAAEALLGAITPRSKKKDS